VRLPRREPAEIDRHAECRELVVGDLAACVAEDELGDLVGAELLSVPLALDQLRGVDHSTIGRPGVPLAALDPPSHVFTVAPTSANSPSSWSRPPAFLPCTYASSSACSRE